MTWRPRMMLRRNRVSLDGTFAVGFGFRFGYWPCLKAPYLQLAFAIWRADFWIGLPSYQGNS